MNHISGFGVKFIGSLEWHIYCTCLIATKRKGRCAMTKMIISNRFINKALEFNAHSLLRPITVQFMLTNSENKNRENKKEQNLFLYGEGAFGGFIWDTLLLVHGLAQAIPTGQAAITHSADTFHPEHLSSVKRMFFKKRSSPGVSSNNSSTQAAPSA